MNKSIALSVSLAALLSSAAANAIVHKTGVIENLDLSSNTLTLSKKNGQTTKYRLAEHTRVVVDGKAQSLAALAVDQRVTLALPSPEKASNDYINAEIVNVDLEAGIAVVQPKGSKSTVNVRFDQNTKVSGKVSSLEELAEGQTIKIRYAANI